MNQITGRDERVLLRGLARTNPMAMFKRLCVNLTDDVAVDLLVSNGNWSKILRGEDITIRGTGYYRDGVAFYDFWDFSDGLDGKLVVRYGARKKADFSAIGFVGTPREACDLSRGLIAAGPPPVSAAPYVQGSQASAAGRP